MASEIHFEDPAIARRLTKASVLVNVTPTMVNILY